MVGKKRISIPVECKVCNLICKDSAARSAHLRKVHNIKTDEDKINYLLTYDTNNDYYCETGDGSLKEFKRAVLAEIPVKEKCYKLSKDKYQFVKKLAGRFDKFRRLADYLFLDLCLTMEEITKDVIEENKSKFSATSLEYFMKKTNGDIKDAKRLQKERQSTTSKKSFIKRFGEEEGIVKFEEHFNNIHSKVKGKSYNTLESFIEKYGEEKGTDKFKKAKMLGAHTLENFIRRHGEEKGKILYKNWKKTTARTLENFQKTYGKEEGKQRYQKYRSNFGSRFGEASKESLEVFKTVHKYLNNIGISDDNIYYGVDGSKEYFLYDKKTDNFYLFDFTIRSEKLIIEYNGLTYHPSKEKLTEDEWNTWKEPYSKMTADEKLQKDQEKIQFAEKNGFTVLEIWSDYSPEENINIVKNFINSKLKIQ